MYPHAGHWKTYLETQYQKDVPIKKAVGLDVWKMFYDFIELTGNNNAALDKVLEEGTMYA